MVEVLVTGGAGFIGSNFVRYALNQHADWHVTTLDKLTYAGRRENLHDLMDNPRHAFVHGDIADAPVSGPLVEKSNIVVQSESTDGGLTWGPWRVLVDLGDLKPCEPEVVRSPDGRQLLCLIRENVRTEPAHFITSDDEGKTWSEVKALPPGLHGDRHKAVYDKDGRLVITFRANGVTVTRSRDLTIR